MLTTQKRKFALALMSGKNKTASAIAAGYSAKTARVKGSQLAKDPEVLAFYSAAIFLIPICISFDTAEKRRYATYLILNRRFSFEF
ncbi:terminase small subunit [Escherichia coli 3-373-03_S1_C1]|nr:terminase small subunit [Escherichia coli 3-373-03_S1_C2]KDU42661.1 terminase small subunit [Escherichia coli 3-373-03_S1_C3]KDU47573.1 terminase small subunit [Escherichia coli 3-373-03_S1_C1]